MAGINQSLMDFLKRIQDSNPDSWSCYRMYECLYYGWLINKAAYVTGTASSCWRKYTFMAGVSAACIAPPLITTVAVLFKKPFDTDERNAGLVSFILGSTHITEGAILSLPKIHFAQCLQWCWFFNRCNLSTYSAYKYLLLTVVCLVFTPVVTSILIGISHCDWFLLSVVLFLEQLVNHWIIDF